VESTPDVVDNGGVASRTRQQRWTAFLLICVAIALIGRIHPLQLAILGVGLVAIGVAVITSRRFGGSGH
jgi:hypothetical protein